MFGSELIMMEFCSCHGHPTTFFIHLFALLWLKCYFYCGAHDHDDDEDQHDDEGFSGSPCSHLGLLQ